HRSKNVTLYRQGDVNFILNAEPESFAQAFARLHGPSVCAIAFRVADSAKAYQRAIALGAKPVHGKVGPMELNIPAIEGIGGSLIYLVDRYGERNIYDVDFIPLVDDKAPPGVGLTEIDHLTHNVHRGRMEQWAQFYERLFNFREIRYFDIEGKLTGLRSKAMTSPDGKIRIPINESADDKSQIAEYLAAYHGEGIQHIALATNDIFATIEALRACEVSFMSVPDPYYEAVDTRLPGHGEDLDRLRRDRILIDGAPGEGQGLLLQIFTATVIGPIFFEIIQRKGNDGFGEGNFRALFESIERDQIRRGVLTPSAE
ncbi:MAG TPA: 4-hydroxyphenylpyruvate dioxygenase, partial [Stellaceae bacterium]|nr:4-hydroxyphenylpyruvate dioxygenase [Stellaceae bacterium]